jgi:hypothetical protein
MAEEVEGMAEASVVVAAISVAEVAISAVAVVILVVVAVSAVAISPVAAAISLGLPGVVLAAIALRNTGEGVSSTGITSNMEIVFGTETISGTIAVSFLEVPFCMITPTTGMITPTTGMIIHTTGMIIGTRTTDIPTTDIMRTTAFAVNREALPSDLTVLPDWTLPLRRCRDRLRSSSAAKVPSSSASFYQPVFPGEYPGWSFETGCVQALSA